MPLNRGEQTFGKDVRDLAFCVDVPNAYGWVVSEDLKEKVEVDPMRSGAVTQRKCPLLNGHFDDGLVVFENNELAVTKQWRQRRRDEVNIRQVSQNVRHVATTARHPASNFLEICGFWRLVRLR